VTWIAPSDCRWTSRGRAHARRIPSPGVSTFEFRKRLHWPPATVDFTSHRCGQAAPDARPAHRKGDRCRPVSWLAGRRPSPPSRACAQWHLEGASRLQLRGQPRIWPHKSRPYRVPKGSGRLLAGPPAPMPIEPLNACCVKPVSYIKISLYHYYRHDPMTRSAC